MMGGTMNQNRQEWRDSVLECGCPLPLLFAQSRRKRQRTGALQDLTVFRNGSWRASTSLDAHWDHELVEWFQPRMDANGRE